MASEVNRGEIWLYVFGAPDKRWPVLVRHMARLFAGHDLLHLRQIERIRRAI
jgi:hypothetical protein